MKRLLVVADIHSGHRFGLRVNNKLKHWQWFAREIDKLRPIDICLANGDLIEGKNTRAGGTELLTADRFEQAEWASEILRFIDSKKYIFTLGTPYHVGDEEDYETLIAKKFGGDIKAQQFFEINGLVFHAKHKIAASNIPHGRFTALARQKVWNLFWSEFDEVPRAKVFIRSHVHYFDYCGNHNWLAMITPALQGWGSKYGSRDCEGIVDFGFVYFDIKDKEHYSWQSCIPKRLDVASTLTL